MPGEEEEEEESDHTACAMESSNSKEESTDQEKEMEEESEEGKPKGNDKPSDYQEARRGVLAAAKSELGGLMRSVCCCDLDSHALSLKVFAINVLLQSGLRNVEQIV
jgi:hypothetical protein